MHAVLYAVFLKVLLMHGCILVGVSVYTLLYMITLESYALKRSHEAGALENTRCISMHEVVCKCFPQQKVN